MLDFCFIKRKTHYEENIKKNLICSLNQPKIYISINYLYPIFAIIIKC